MKWVEIKENTLNLIDDNGKCYFWLDELNKNWAFMPREFDIDPDSSDWEEWIELNEDDKEMTKEEAILAFKEKATSLCKKMADFYTKLADSIPEE